MKKPKCIRNVLVPEYFEEIPETSKYKCLHCGAKVFVTKEVKGSSLSNLTSHLMRADHSEYLEKYKAAVVEAEAAASQPKTKPLALAQPKIDDAFARRVPYKKGSSQEEKFHRLVLEFLVESNLPFALVERPSFQRLLDFVAEGRAQLHSDEFYRNHLDDMYVRVKAALKRWLADAEPVFAITTDGYGDTSSHVQIQSLVAHVIKANRRYKVCLSALPLDEAKTGDYIKSRLVEGLESWGIGAENLASVTHDGESSLVKAVRNLVADHFPQATALRCLQHCAQLCVEDGFKAQPELENLMRRCRKVANHFSHSTSSALQLEKAQEQLGVPKLRVKGFCETRWDSQFSMLERLVAVEDSLRLLSASRGSKVPHVFSDYDFELMRALVEYLRIFREFSLAMQCDEATLGPVLGFLKSLRVAFQPKDEDPLRLMKEAHIRCLSPDPAHPEKRRLDGIELNPAFCLAAALDPRLKVKSLSPEQREVVETQMGHWVAKAQSAYASRELESEKVPVELSSESPAKKAKKDADPPLSLWPTASSSNESVEEEGKGDWERQFLRFSKSSRLPRVTSPVAYWAEDADYPALKKLGLFLGSMTPSQCSSEQMFSVVSTVLAPRRCSLLSENVEKIVFLQKALKLLDYDY